MKMKSIILLGLVMFLSGNLFAQAHGATPTAPTTTNPPNTPAVGDQNQPTMGQQPSSSTKGSTTGPMTEKEVITELKKRGADQLQKDLDARGVAFEMDPDIEKSLRKAKATDQVIKAVTAAGPKEKAAAAKAAAMANGDIIIPPAENADYKALQGELDPDKVISLANAFITKYPQSTILSYAYSYEANGYKMKGDLPQVVEFAEKSVALKPDNLMSLDMLAFIIPSTQFMGLHRSDQSEQLDKAEKYAQAAFKALDELKKPANVSDADFAKQKALAISDIHADEGMIHIDRAQLGLMGLDTEELNKAEKEYRLAVSGTDQPDPTAYFRLGETCKLLGKYDDAIAAFNKAGELSPTQLKPLADRQIEALKNAKSQSAAPAK
ncbi:MAG: tetratricopeptide repeat protein [Terriglobia bacterium]